MFEKIEPEESVASLLNSNQVNAQNQRQKILEQTKVKSMMEQTSFREFQSTVLASKVAQENQALVQMKKERQARERAESKCTQEYAGGRLPQHEAVVKVEQERELQKKQCLQEAIVYNSQRLNQKSGQHKQSKVPLCENEEKAYLSNREQAQVVAWKTLSDKLAQKKRLIETEQKEVAQIEERIKLTEADLKSTQEQKKQQEEWRDYRVVSYEEMKDHWNTQLQRKQENKKVEKSKDLQFLRERTNRELQLLEEERQKAREKRLMEKELMDDNAKLIQHRRFLDMCRRKNEQEADKRDAHLQAQANPTYEEYVEQEIDRAAADNRFVVPLLAEKQKQETRDDKMYIYRPGMCEPVPKKTTVESQKLKNKERQHRDFNDKAHSSEGLYIRSSTRCDSTQKYGCSEESQKIKEKVQRQHITFGNIEPCETKPARAQKRLTKNLPSSRSKQDNVGAHLTWDTQEPSAKYVTEEQEPPHCNPWNKPIDRPTTKLLPKRGSNSQTFYEIPKAVNRVFLNEPQRVTKEEVPLPSFSQRTQPQTQLIIVERFPKQKSEFVNCPEASLYRSKDNSTGTRGTLSDQHSCSGNRFESKKEMNLYPNMDKVEMNLHRNGDKVEMNLHHNVDKMEMNLHRNVDKMEMNLHRNMDKEEMNHLSSSLQQANITDDCCCSGNRFESKEEMNLHRNVDS
ncbi:hypothetical protein WMY93_016216 [Mugilogobius chulae]|uniref:CCDC66 domain-containing protein n=1 Tax=Mugilogobius chulae TaxID=88201 RepID=A0AAW0P2E8_9GOBI